MALTERRAYRFGRLLALLSIGARFVYAQTGYMYQLDTEYSGANFFSGWDFFETGPGVTDPTNGLVTYYSAANAQSAGLINASANAPTYIGVDYTNVVPTYPNNEYGAGRASVRISTQRAWTHGLFIGDFAHAPGGICGTWPACGCHCDPTRYRADGVGWTLAPNWPNNGEIDILEGANSATQNLMSLHTSPECSVAGDSTTETGQLQGTNCAYYTGGGNPSGCGVADSRNNSYGAGFNAIGGGVYAMQWTSDYINIWFFPRNVIPEDIANLAPDPSSWGLPAANLQGDCDIDQHFQGHSIVFDNTFCGDYAGNPAVWDSAVNSCATSTGYSACEDFVANNPSAFQDSYWSINSVRVYQLQVNDTNSTTTPYIASLQPTSTLASSSTPPTSVPSPTTSYCPTYNFTAIQLASSEFEIICGYNYAGPDIGSPPGYTASTFEQCVQGCSQWNTLNGANYCVMVAWDRTGQFCYYKNGVDSTPADSGFDSARLLYYGYPQIADNPNSSTTMSASSTYVSTPVIPQTYENPTTSSSSQTLTSASGASSILGVGMGGSATLNVSTYIGAVSTNNSQFSGYLSQTVTSGVVSTSPTFSTTSTPTGLGLPTIQTSTVTLTTIFGSANLTTSSISLTSVPSSTLLNTGSLPSTSNGLSNLSTTQSPNTVLTTITSSTYGSVGSSNSPSITPTTTEQSGSLLSVSSTLIGQTSIVDTTHGGGGGTASPTPTYTGEPQVVDGFVYYGCLGSSSGYSGLRLAENSQIMSIEQCIADCYESAYAALSGSICYCGDSVNAIEGYQRFADSSCSIQCPGDPSENCGGQVSTGDSYQRRSPQVVDTGEETLIVVYENESVLSGTVTIILVSSTSEQMSSTSSTQTSTASTPNGVLIIVSTIWVDVCDGCISGTTQLTTTITVVHCGCTETTGSEGATGMVAPPSVPMTTTVKPCACGENGAASSMIITEPCSSAIAEESSLLGEYLSSCSAVPGAQVPSPIPWQSQAIAAGVTSASQNPGMEAETTSASLNTAEAMATARVGAPTPTVSANTGTVYVTSMSDEATQTISLQITGLNETMPLSAARNLDTTSSVESQHPTIFATALPPAGTQSKASQSFGNGIMRLINILLVGVLGWVFAF